MRFINSLLVVLIIAVYSLAFTIHPWAKEILAPGELAETESETEQPYSDDDFYELSHVIQAEAGYCERDMMIGVGSVVLNRVEHEDFPDTVYEVIHQPGQYSTVSHLSSQVPTELVEEVTDYLLRNGSEYPSDVVYQANFPQGSGTYLTLSTSYSTMYFCYR